MKKTLSLLLTGALALTAMPALAEGDQTAQATYGTPVIDGQIDSVWDTAAPYIIAAGDTTSEIRMLWDDNALYMLAKVQDPNKDATAGAAYQQDSVELFVDEKNDKTMAYGSDDAHYRVNYLNMRSTDAGDASRFYTATTQTDDGYVVEMAYQWKEITPGNETKVGFDAQMNICADGTRSAAPALFDVTGNAYQNTGLFGHLLLTGKPDGAEKAAYPYALLYAVEVAEGRDLTVYTNPEIVAEPLANARKLAESTTATQSELDAAAQALSDALGALDDGSGFVAADKLPALEDAPDLMTMLDGTKVTTAEQWAARREEIMELYRYYVYGYMPDTSNEQLSYTLTDTEGGKDLAITVTNGDATTTFHTLVTMPEGDMPEGGFPYYIEYSYYRWFGGASDVAKYAASRGYAAISYMPTDVAADNTTYAGSFYTLYPYGESYKTQTGTLVAWTWGVSKIIDAMEAGAAQELGFNAAYCMVGGVSRYGKGTAVAGAYEPRIKVVIPSCSGAGGLAPFRFTTTGRVYDLASLGYADENGSTLWTNTTNESLKNLQSESEQHWFCGNFQKIAAPANMPVEQDMLAALSASPDRYFIAITGITSEAWNCAEGQVITVKKAQPAYDIVGAGDHVGIIVHLNGHAILESDMVTILDYLDVQLYGKEAASDLSVMQHNLFMEEPNASDLMKQVLGK